MNYSKLSRKPRLIMEEITLKNDPNGKSFPVFIGKLRVGVIKKVINQNVDGYSYFPKGSMISGETYKTLNDCFKSLKD